MMAEQDDKIWHDALEGTFRKRTVKQAEQSPQAPAPRVNGLSAEDIKAQANLNAMLDGPAPAPAPKPKAKGMFHPMTATEATKGRDLQWKFKNLVPRTGFGQICAKSKEAKTFLALAMCEALVDGASFFGFKVQYKAPVVFVCLEGEGGFRRRIRALEKWREIHGKPPLPPEMLFVIDEHFAINNPTHVKELAAVCPKDSLIVVDTQNASAPLVDLNSSKEMGGILQGAKELKQLTGGFVFLIAHEGHNAQGRPIGISTQLPNCDTFISVSSSKGGGRKWKLGKMKDAEDGMEFSFRLEKVDLGLDENGDPVVSCVAVPAETKDENLLTGPQLLLFDLLKKALRKNNGDPVNEDKLKAVFRTKYKNGDLKEESVERAFRRAKNDLIALGLIVVTDGYYRTKSTPDTDK